MVYHKMVEASLESEIQMEIRRYQPGEEAEIWKLYFDTTHKIDGKIYTKDQCLRWAPSDKDPKEWETHLESTNPFVALENGQIVGFAELEKNGHINKFYCHYEWQGQGIGTALMVAIENESKTLGLKRIFSECSVNAINFFRAKGFVILEERVNTVCGAPAKQFLVERNL